MLKILVPTLMILPAAWFAPPPFLWASTLALSMLIAIFSLYWLKDIQFTTWSCINPVMGADTISIPLLLLTCWLLPLMILASQRHMNQEPVSHQRMYISILIFLQIFLVLAFSTTNVIMFYIMFEATLIPTIMLMVRWGIQELRLSAGSYFLMYTIVASIPLLVTLLFLDTESGSLSILNTPYKDPSPPPEYLQVLWVLSCLMAFMVKMPLYGTHLWLPKAHVEAPVAGSMVLAAVLLKLGGYGMIRISPLLHPEVQFMCYPFLVAAMWGSILAGTNCLRQTDLKALIAYSSVSHMSVVIIGVLIQTPSSISGAMLLMIAHGLTSSALFCLANSVYERTNSRTLLLTRGLHVVLPLLSTWWFLAILCNIALPPLPNMLAEILVLTALYDWSWWAIVLPCFLMLLTLGYTFFLFMMSQRGPPSPQASKLDPSFTREHLIIFLHLIPLLLLIANPGLILKCL